MVEGGQAICRKVRVLVQHMAVMVPDKAEFRGGRWQKPRKLKYKNLLHTLACRFVVL